MADTNSHRFNDCGVICFGGVKPTDTPQMLFSPPIRGPTSPWQAGRLPQNTAIGEGPEWVVCHERGRSTRLRATVREMKEGPSGSVIRSLIPSHRKLLWSKAMVVSVAEKSGHDPVRQR